MTDGVVSAVGSGLSIPDGADVVDGRGATVLPGLVDAHVHVVQWATSRQRVDVLAADSADDVAARIKAAVADRTGERALTPDEVVVGQGFRPALWQRPPHKDVLDAAFGPQPVAVLSMDLHTIWLNSAALTLVGRGGHPTGVLTEGDCFAVTAAMTERQPVDLVDRWVLDAMHAAAARGVTRITDFEFADTYADWQRRESVAEVPVRVECSVWLPWLDAALARGLATGTPIPGPDGRPGRLQMGWFKVITDGSLNTRTAFCFDPYPEVPDGDEAYGLQLVPAQELVEQMRRAWSAGIQPAVHAIGDQANSIALDAFEAVGCPGRIEHAQLIRPDDVPRFARAGLIASVQPQHATADRDVADRHWHGRTPWAYPYGALHAAGVRLEFGSDAPVSPLDPWQAIADAVTRTVDGRPPWHPEQRLSLDVALRAASGGRAGIAVGDPADLVLVAADPATVPPAELPANPVLATIVGGRFTYRDEAV
jgi:hypothetical protein